jgi:hypothetical protein
MATPTIGLESASANLYINQGSTFDETVTYVEDDEVTPINLTGYTARAQLRSGYGGTLITTLTTENSGITLGGVLGTIRMTIAPVVTAAYTPATFANGAVVWDLEIIDALGKITRLLQGVAELSKEVTI